MLTWDECRDDDDQLRAFLNVAESECCAIMVGTRVNSFGNTAHDVLALSEGEIAALTTAM